MDNIFNRINSNLNSSNETAAKIHPELAKAKYFYNDFVEKMNKSDFCNTNKRYIAELAYVRRLKDLYLENNDAILAKEMSDREAVIIEKLKNDFGITY